MDGVDHYGKLKRRGSIGGLGGKSPWPVLGGGTWMVSSGSMRKERNGKSGGWWSGLETLEEDPITKGAEGWALYNELWSKLRWTLGTTFQMPYGKSSPWAGDLGRRLALVVLSNRPDSKRPLI